MTIPMQTTVPGTVRELEVPDTLDLADRAALALNGLGGNIDESLMTMYGQIRFCARRPHFAHWGSAETLCDTVEVSFPVRDTTLRYTMNAHTADAQEYALTLRGSTVVDSAPRIPHPTRLQLYQREALRQAGPAPVREVQRFVAERVVRGW